MTTTKVKADRKPVKRQKASQTNQKKKNLSFYINLNKEIAEPIYVSHV